MKDDEDDFYLPDLPDMIYDKVGATLYLCNTSEYETDKELLIELALNILEHYGEK